MKSWLSSLVTSAITKCKRYNIESTQVTVTWQEFLPPGKEPPPGKAVLFFPGWPLRVDSKSIRELAEELANYSGTKTFVIQTRDEQIISNSLFQEAQAICKFLMEAKTKDVTLVGYSQGGIKATDTIALLQEMNSDIHVEGLILVVPVGLYEIDGLELARRYTIDALIISPKVFLKVTARKHSLRAKLISLFEYVALTVQASLSFFIALSKEARASKFQYFSRFKNEVKEMSRQNPYIYLIQVPIVLIQGAWDYVSDHEKVLAQVRIQSIQAELLDTTIAYPEANIDAREQTNTERLFPQSPYVRMLRAEKFGTHLLPLFRSKAVARVSLYLLQRASREYGEAA